MRMDASKQAKHRFAVEAARRIGEKIHESISKTREPITFDVWRDMWKEEGRAAKDAGLYSTSTYYGDAGNSIRTMAEAQGWGAKA